MKKILVVAVFLFILVVTDTMAQTDTSGKETAVIKLKELFK